MKLSFPEHHLFQLLRRYENQHLPLDLFLSHYFRVNKALGAKDRQLIAKAVFGMTRWKSLLDHLIGELPSWERRYAIYCRFQPANYLTVNSIPLPIRVSSPPELLSLLIKQYGEEQALKLSQVSNTEAPITIRCNPLKISREELLARWAHYEPAPTLHSPYGIQFKERLPLVSFPEFKEGLFEIQDEASQLVALLVEAKPGEHVLDFCAGAGGKTLAFAHRLENQGQIYLHDNRPLVLQQARKRLNRAGLQNVQFLPEGHKGLARLKGKMDWVIVDVPCTGTGTLRRNPDQKWKFSCELFNRLIGVQRGIFAEALPYLKPGGHILYATCSLLEGENQKQVSHFLEQHNLLQVGSPFISLPTYGGMDGFFAALFQKPAFSRSMPG